MWKRFGTSSSRLVDLGFWAPSFGTRKQPRVAEYRLSSYCRSTFSCHFQCSSIWFPQEHSSSSVLSSFALGGVTRRWMIDVQGLMHTHLALQGSFFARQGWLKSIGGHPSAEAHWSRGTSLCRPLCMRLLTAIPGTHPLSGSSPLARYHFTYQSQFKIVSIRPR